MGPPEQLLEPGEFVALAADLATIRAGVGLPPGTRVRFELAPDSSGAAPLTLTGKIVGLAREDASYRITVRLTNLSRELRLAVIAAAERRR